MKLKKEVKLICYIIRYNIFIEEMKIRILNLIHEKSENNSKEIDKKTEYQFKFKLLPSEKEYESIEEEIKIMYAEKVMNIILSYERVKKKDQDLDKNDFSLSIYCNCYNYY